jgi:hypothetical protein
MASPGLYSLKPLVAGIFTFLSPLQKRARRILLHGGVWVAYLLCDWIAAVAIGLISKRKGDARDQRPREGSNEEEDFMAFWASFLLLHLGGPDTIILLSAMSAEVEYRCFVGGLAWATDDEALQRAFSAYGDILESKVTYTCFGLQEIKDRRFTIRPRPIITTFQKKKKKDQDLHVLTLQYRTLFRDCFLADTTPFLGK